MDNLKNYGGDSDSQDESEDAPAEETESPSSSAGETQPHMSLSREREAKETWIENSSLQTAETATTSFNFLGLESADKASSSTFHDPEVQRESRKVSTCFGEVEIPNGDFWSDFIPEYSSDTPVQQTDHREYYRIQTGEAMAETDSPAKESSVSLQAQKSLKRYSDYNFKTTVNYSGHSKRIKHDQLVTHSSGLQDHPRDSAQLIQRGMPPSANGHSQLAEQPVNLRNSQHNQQAGTNQKRKLYFIHSKVSPYLNAKPVNKCSGRLTDTWPAHMGVVNRLVWNVPNFSHLLLSAGMDASVRLWNAWSSLDHCVATLSSHRKAVKHAEWCHSGRKVLSCSYDRTAQVTDVETVKQIGQYEHLGFVTAGQVHPSNPNVFVTGTENMVLKWDMRVPQTPVKHFSYKDKFGQVQDLLFINESQELVSCSELVSRDCADRSIMVWDLRTGTILSNQIYQERYMCTRLKLHPNGSIFMAQTHAGYVALFSTISPYKMDKSKRYEGHKTQGYSVGFDLSPDGSLVYSGSAENGIHCYHQQSGKLIRKLTSGNGSDVFTDVACHPVLPSVLASSSWGGSLSLWM